MLGIAVVLAVAATLVGFYGSPVLHVGAGPLTIAAAAGLFLLSLVKRRAG